MCPSFNVFSRITNKEGYHGLSPTTTTVIRGSEPVLTGLRLEPFGVCYRLHLGRTDRNVALEPRERNE